MNYAAFEDARNLLIPQAAAFYKVLINDNGREKSYIIKAFSDFDAARKIKDLTGFKVGSPKDVKGPLSSEEVIIMKQLNAYICS